MRLLWQKMLVPGLAVLLVAGCQPVTSEGAVQATVSAVAEATEAPTAESAAEPAAEATTMDHGSMDHGSMDHGAMGDAQFDAQFLDGMVAHHEGAIAMAEQVLAESDRPELREMAEAIIAAQEGEITQMQAWRAEWYPGLAPTAGMDMDMGMMELAVDETKPFEQRFMEAMIDHHEGALDMAQAALEQAEHPELRTMAEAVIVAQEAEIEQMRGWLSEWYGVQ
jgi:uncharacterized protein (DUF305 family)